jgi:hypothetical protein
MEAMAREEGWLVPTSRPRRNNNPGDIEYGRFALALGATGTDGRFAIFPSPVEGFEAMKALLLSGYSKLTVAQGIAKYAPSNENDTNAYVQRVCEWTPCKATDLIGDILND